MKPVLEWLDDEVTVSNGLLLRLCPSEERQEWDWYAYDLQGLELGTGTDDGRGVEHAKAQAEAFAREWIAEQAVALGDGWISCQERMPESDDGWYHVAVHDYKGRYPRHAIAQFTRDRFWIDGDDGEGDSVFAWRHPALPPLPVAEVKE